MKCDFQSNKPLGYFTELTPSCRACAEMLRREDLRAPALEIQAPREGVPWGRDSEGSDQLWPLSTAQRKRLSFELLLLSRLAASEEAHEAASGLSSSSRFSAAATAASSATAAADMRLLPEAPSCQAPQPPATLPPATLLPEVSEQAGMPDEFGTLPGSTLIDPYCHMETAGETPPMEHAATAHASVKATSAISFMSGEDGEDGSGGDAMQATVPQSPEPPGSALVDSLGATPHDPASVEASAETCGACDSESDAIREARLSLGMGRAEAMGLARAMRLHVLGDGPRFGHMAPYVPFRLLLLQLSRPESFRDAAEYSLHLERQTPPPGVRHDRLRPRPDPRLARRGRGCRRR